MIPLCDLIENPLGDYFTPEELERRLLYVSRLEVCGERTADSHGNFYQGKARVNSVFCRIRLGPENLIVTEKWKLGDLYHRIHGPALIYRTPGDIVGEYHVTGISLPGIAPALRSNEWFMGYLKTIISFKTKRQAALLLGMAYGLVTAEQAQCIELAGQI